MRFTAMIGAVVLGLGGLAGAAEPKGLPPVVEATADNKAEWGKLMHVSVDRGADGMYLIVISGTEAKTDRVRAYLSVEEGGSPALGVPVPPSDVNNDWVVMFHAKEAMLPRVRVEVFVQPTGAEAKRYAVRPARFSPAGAGNAGGAGAK